MRCGIWIVVFGLLLGPAARAQQSYGVGFFVPELPIDPYQRFNYVQGLAKQLSTKLGAPVQGFAYKSEGDLRRDQKLKKIQFAVLGGFFLAAQRPGKVLSHASLSGRQQASWTLMCKVKTEVTALKGKVLQLPGLGALVYGLVQHGLLGGNVEVRRHFKVVESPDLASAVEAVRLGQAQVVFAPTSSAGLRPLLANTLQVPSPALVALDPELADDKLAAVTEAAIAYKAVAGPLVGWGGKTAVDFPRFAALARRRVLRMEMVPLPLERLRPSDLVAGASPLKYELPELDDVFVVP